MKERLSFDTMGLSTQFKKRFVKDAFLDWKIWAFSFMCVQTLSLAYLSKIKLTCSGYRYIGQC